MTRKRGQIKQKPHINLSFPALCFSDCLPLHVSMEESQFQRNVLFIWVWFLCFFVFFYIVLTLITRLRVGRQERKKVVTEERIKVINITKYYQNCETAWSWHYISGYLEEVPNMAGAVLCHKGLFLFPLERYYWNT